GRAEGNHGCRRSSCRSVLLARRDLPCATGFCLPLGLPNKTICPRNSSPSHATRVIGSAGRPVVSIENPGLSRRTAARRRHALPAPWLHARSPEPRLPAGPYPLREGRAMPSLTVFQPPTNLMVQPNQPFLVTGQASDRGPPEPATIDSVTVQVDNGPVIEAQLTHIPNRTITLYSFKAFAQVTGGQDPHTVTITATNDSNISVKQTRQGFTRPVFQVHSPAILPHP